MQDEGRDVRLEVACLLLSPLGLPPKGHFSEDCPPFVLSRADLCPPASPTVSPVLPSEPELACYDLGMALLAYKGTYWVDTWPWEPRPSQNRWVYMALDPVHMRPEPPRSAPPGAHMGVAHGSAHSQHPIRF